MARQKKREREKSRKKEEKEVIFHNSGPQRVVGVEKHFTGPRK